jgi:hypothetical protein
MWWRGAAGAVVVLGIAVASGARAQELPPGEPLAYAVFSGAETRLGKQVKVYGNVGSNDTLRIGRKNRIDGLVAAPTIDLGRNSKTGLLFCLLVIGGDHPCLSLTAPVVSPGSLGVGLVLPGTEDVDVPRRAHRAPLEAGSYKTLSLGRGSELMLLGGDYLFNRVSLARKATLTCATACRVAIRRTLRLGSRSAVKGLAGVGPTDLRFDVSGHKSRTGVKVGKRASFGGILWAPATTVKLGSRAKVAGSVQGAELRIGSRAQIGTQAEATIE